MVKTLAEVHADRVTVTITLNTEQEHPSLTEVVNVLDQATDRPVAGLSERLYTAEEVGILQASEAELVAAPLRRRIHELWEERNGHLGTIEALRAQIDALAAEDPRSQLATAQKAREIETDRANYWKRKAEEWDIDRHTEQTRADKNKAWARRVEEQRDKLNERLTKIRGLVEDVPKKVPL